MDSFVWGGIGEAETEWKRVGWERCGEVRFGLGSEGLDRQKRIARVGQGRVRLGVAERECEGRVRLG